MPRSPTAFFPGRRATGFLVRLIVELNSFIGLFVRVSDTSTWNPDHPIVFFPLNNRGCFFDAAIVLSPRDSSSRVILLKPRQICADPKYSKNRVDQSVPVCSSIRSCGALERRNEVFGAPRRKYNSTKLLRLTCLKSEIKRPDFLASQAPRLTDRPENGARKRGE